ncbi:MAG: S8 family serine peptidase [Muribaculaceae bacterium]|nr:S8 family serine peptidase [Muribaculaceae bacterium]MDE6632383.1 S8 family serine peptidase [Muribaculaceae bacterium]
MKRYILLLILITDIIFFEGGIYAEDNNPSYIPRIVKIYSEEEADSLAEQGVDILRRRGDILLCLFPNTSTRSEDSRQRTRAITPTLDVAKGFYDAGSIQNGKATGTPYTGKGIVVGICDIGIDPLHPTFLDSNGQSRIKRVVQYIEEEGIRRQLDGDDDYRNWVTDTHENYHATHVCGILAGRGAGTPYSGIAADADIVVTVSTLTEVGLLAGVEDIIDYAKEAGKPAVINISVGSYNGAHDGSSLFSQYLDMCADDAIIVLSAGNEGRHYNSLISPFDRQTSSVAFHLGNTAWDEFNMYGVTEIWSGMNTPLNISLGLYDTNVKNIVRWDKPFSVDGKDIQKYIWNGEGSADEGFPFVGELLIEGGINPENGRHCTTLSYDFKSEEMSSNGGWARYELAVKVTGEPGNDVEVYADGIYTRLSGLSGSPAPTKDRSISDLACGFRVISVGMYGNRDSIPFSAPIEFQDETVYFQPSKFKYGATVDYSSYGTLRDGRVLPLTVAPGGSLMSAASRPYFERYPYHPHLRSGDTIWVDEGGTSMSSPYVAGYIATWLEADPTLTVEDVKKILASTNRLDIPEPDDPRNANGYFDPVKGLMMALNAGKIEGIEDSGMQPNPDDHIEIYDLTGVKRYAGAASGMSGIEKGLYIFKTPYGAKKIAISGKND